MKYLISVFIIVFILSCKSAPVANHTLISDTLQIKKDLEYILNTNGFRNFTNLNALNRVADYIKLQFREISDSVSEQKYEFGENEYRNIICSINTDKKERIIIGAHYDVFGNQDGADDNASGVAGLLELARLLKTEKLNYRIDFVAYTLEEPPFFRSELMGSYIHAKYIHENQVKIKGMICIEMIGYFSDKAHSQGYPVGFLRWFYGNKGDFIMIAQKNRNGKFGNDIKKNMKKINIIPTKSFKVPKFLGGIDLSDHRNYWNFGYSAVMITNTSFYRNKNYHTKKDTLETLDIKKLGLTIDELFLTLKEIP